MIENGSNSSEQIQQNKTFQTVSVLNLWFFFREMCLEYASNSPGTATVCYDDHLDGGGWKRSHDPKCKTPHCMAQSILLNKIAKYKLNRLYGELK